MPQSLRHFFNAAFFARAVICTAIGALILCTPAHAATTLPSECRNPPPITVTIEPVFEDVRYDFNRSIQEIKSKGTGTENPAPKDHWPVGLAEGKLTLYSNSSIQMARRSDTQFTCGYITSVTIKMGFFENVIYVARELPANSCPHQTVLEHEERHKTVDRELLQEYTNKAEAYFGELARRVGVVSGNGTDQVQTQLKNRMDEGLQHFTRIMSDDRVRRQSEVDTGDEYARVSASCDGELMQMVNRSMSRDNTNAPR